MSNHAFIAHNDTTYSTLSDFKNLEYVCTTGKFNICILSTIWVLSVVPHHLTVFMCTFEHFPIWMTFTTQPPYFSKLWHSYYFVTCHAFTLTSKSSIHVNSPLSPCSTSSKFNRESVWWKLSAQRQRTHMPWTTMIRQFPT